MPATRERDETFTVLDGHLVRSVVPARGKPYEHRCPLESFETIAHAVDEFGEADCTLETLVVCEAPPSTQVAVAVAFLKERGVIETRYRRKYPATDSVHLDAMIEFHALAENR